MKNNNLTKATFAALLSISAVASADSQYPAADFQPSVVFQDESYINSHKSEAPAVKAAPVPVAAKPAPVSEDDAKYPAANFQPTVVFSDANYQHKSGEVSSSKNQIAAPKDSGVAQTAEVETSSVATAKKSDDSSSYLIGLVGLAVVGFFLFRGKEQCPASIVSEQSNSPAPAPTSSSGLTGVARYLNKKSGTGVSRYLEKQTKTPVTGVARYMAKQTAARAKNKA